MRSISYVKRCTVPGSSRDLQNDNNINIKCVYEFAAFDFTHNTEHVTEVTDF